MNLPLLLLFEVHCDVLMVDWPYTLCCSQHSQVWSCCYLQYNVHAVYEYQVSDSKCTWRFHWYVFLSP